MKVGFIGLGLMGAPMSRNLLKAGHSVRAWNRTSAKVDAFVADGGEASASPADAAAGAEVVITMVTDSPDVQAVILGEGGVIEGVAPGTVVVDMSTISPEVTRSVGAALAERGVPMLDAPVSGGVLGAQNAALSIMLGGDEEAFEVARPVLEAMGTRITYCGALGMGQVTKLVNQVIVAGTMAAVCEGLVFGAKAGADLQAVFSGGHGRRGELVAVGEPGRAAAQGRLRAGVHGAAPAEGPAAHHGVGHGHEPAAVHHPAGAPPVPGRRGAGSRRRGHAGVREGAGGPRRRAGPVPGRVAEASATCG